MSLFGIFSLLITLAALFSYINYRFIKLPTTIGVMGIALAGSLVLLGLQRFGFHIDDAARRVIAQIDFDATLLQGMLSFLLFAGSLHINLNDLADEKWSIAVLSTVGVLISMFVFAALGYFGLSALGLPLSFAWCLLFGALISPTDPIAVLGILRTARCSRSLETQIVGESLFNDGIGIVLFLIMLEIVIGRTAPTGLHIGMLFVRQAVGGIAIGLFLGWLTYLLLKSVDNYQVEVLLTLALVMGGYTLASLLEVSGPIAMVCAGLVIGNQGRRWAMSATTRTHLDSFWELVDEILNALLFVLIGFEVLTLNFTRPMLVAGVLAIPVLLLARWLSVVLPILAMSRWRRFARGTVTIMTWGGLRGGLSVALALSLPAGRERDIVVAMTYVLVVFSILGQGFSIRRVVARAMAR